MASDADLARRAYRDVLYEALAGGSGAVRDADPLTLLQRLTDTRATERPVETLLAPLRDVALANDIEAAVERAVGRFPTPDAFRQAVYFARCREREPAGTARLLEGRRYLEDASVPLSFAELATDRAAVLDAATYASLWREPARGEWLLNTTAIWRRGYVARYLAAHAAQQKALATVAERIDAVATKTAALERLNGLQRLGAAVAVAALAQYHDLERLYPCAISPEALAAALDTAPACPACGYVLGDAAPQADARRVASAIERGLASQQARLARRVVGLIIGRPGGDDDARLERFIRAVQASDVTGLALILDSALVDFLRDLLESRAAADPLSRLVEAYPEVTAANLDDAIAAFRHLLEAALAEQNGRVRLGDDGRT